MLNLSLTWFSVTLNCSRFDMSGSRFSILVQLMAILFVVIFGCLVLLPTQCTYTPPSRLSIPVFPLFAMYLVLFIILSLNCYE